MCPNCCCTSQRWNGARPSSRLPMRLRPGFEIPSTSVLHTSSPCNNSSLPYNQMCSHRLITSSGLCFSLPDLSSSDLSRSRTTSEPSTPHSLRPSPLITARACTSPSRRVAQPAAPATRA